MKTRIIFALFALLFQLPYSYSQTGKKEIAALDAYIEKSIRDWEVPGMTVSIVKDGKIILSKGYGVRNMHHPEKVDTKTIFGIASTTKAMTAMAVGMLVDEGKLNWNDKVVDYMPELRFDDAYITANTRVKDLLTHNTGLGNTDFLWYIRNDLNGDEILDKVADIPMTYGFRGGYVYQNIMYLAAGKLIEKVSGIPWGAFVEQRIFKPLGMAGSYPNRAASMPEKNRSTPHYKIDGNIETIQDMDADQVAPAGAVWSNAEDMTKWMICLLDSSKYAGGRLVSSETYNTLFKPHTLIPEESFYPTTKLTKPNWTSYGLGWFQHDYQGRMVNFHTGSLSGTIAIMGLIKEENLGVYILGNLDHAEVRHAIMYKVFDHFLKVKPRDWSKEVMDLYRTFEDAEKDREEELINKKVENTSPSLDLKNYTGTYFSPLYGEVSVELESEKLLIRVTNELSLTLEHWHYDVFQGAYSKKEWGKTLVQFVLNQDGKVYEMTFDNLSYSKVPEE